MKRLKNGFLISLEGIDGAGKSTLAQALYQRFQQAGISVLLTKQPGGTALGKYIRAVVQDYPSEINPIAESLLFAADRAQHRAEIVNPALRDGMLVISDRMADSSRAYQGFGRGVDRDMLEKIIGWTMADVKPDLIFYLALDIDIMWQRILARKEAMSRFEMQDRSFYESVINGFESIFKNRADVVRIDAAQTQEAVAGQAFSVLMDHIQHLMPSHY